MNYDYDTMEAKQTFDARSGALSKSMAALEKSQTELTERLSKLEEMITLLLRPASLPPEQTLKGDVSAVREPTSPLVEHLDDRIRTNRRHIDKINSIIERLEV